MTRPMHFAMTAIATLIATSHVSVLAADQSGELAAQIARLKSEIASLSGESQQWLTEQRAAEIRSIVSDVIADSDTRTSLQGSAATAGYNDGFFLSSADGNFSMKINVLEQIRWTFNDSKEPVTAPLGGKLLGAPGAAVDGGQSYGFENKRTRLNFSGNMVDSSWSYKLGYYLGYSDSAEAFGAGELSDAYVAKDLGNGFSVTVGQFKLPFSAEYEVDVGNLQFMDYSTVTYVFDLGYGQGLKLGYEAEMVRVGVAYVNAFESANADWSASSPAAEWSFVGRVDAKLAGNWSQFEHGQSWRGDGLGAKVGLGLGWERDSIAPGSSTTLFTLDTAVNFGGANVAAAYYVASFNDTGDPTLDGAHPDGFTLNGGLFVTDTVELVARYEWADLDLDLGGAENFSALTFGGNWYLAKNSAKLSADLGYAFDNVTGFYAFEGRSNNWVEDVAGNDGQWMIRTQLSFSF